MKNKPLFIALIVAIVLLVDQVLKIWIKTHLILGEEIEIFSWFKIHFVENKGMAFGLTLGGDYGKLALTLFRIVAVVFIAYLIRTLIAQKNTATGLLVSMAFIIAGAIGNIIDSALYGVIFSDSDGRVAQLFPPEGGYAHFLHGHVVDMLYFPLYEGVLPAWLPIWGGTYFAFFRPVFNIADAAITLGVVAILLFQRGFFNETQSSGTPQTPTLNANSDNVALEQTDKHAFPDMETNNN